MLQVYFRWTGQQQTNEPELAQPYSDHIATKLPLNFHLMKTSRCSIQLTNRLLGMTAYNTTVTVLISMAIVIRECRQRRQRTDMERGIAPTLSKVGQQGWRWLCITVSLVISWIVKIDLKQIYCSYSRTQEIQNGLYRIIFEAWTKANMIGNDIFVFYMFSLPSSLTDPHVPYCCSSIPICSALWVEWLNLW